MPRSKSFNPFTIALDLMQTGAKLAETMRHSGAVVEARMPLIWEAMVSPFSADHGELALMVSEKVGAFGKSADLGARAGKSVLAGHHANMTDLRRMFSGMPLNLQDWWRMSERNLAMTAQLWAMPGVVLAPIHRKARANARRLA